jgi:hypothetical protein
MSTNNKPKTSVIAITAAIATVDLVHRSCMPALVVIDVRDHVIATLHRVDRRNATVIRTVQH